MRSAKTRRHRVAERVLPLMILVFGSPVFAQSPQISERARAVADEFLLSNCVAGDGSRLTSQVNQFKVELEPYFLAVLQRGPDDKLVSDLQRASAARFQQSQDLLKSDRRLPITDEQRKAAQAIGREQYVAQEKDAFILRYKSQAVAGLGIVGGPRARGVLEPLSKDANSPLRVSAQEALKQITPGRPNRR